MSLLAKRYETGALTLTGKSMRFDLGARALFEPSLQLRATITRPYSDSFASVARLHLFRDPQIVAGRLTMDWPAEDLAVWEAANSQPPSRPLDFVSDRSRQLAAIPLSLERFGALLLVRTEANLRPIATLLGQEYGCDADLGESILSSLLEALPSMPEFAEEPGVTTVEVRR
ncbi:hypothetical protein [Sphingomonas astaxanthinifaciens]|uniref:Uncharacterized protein n=1 Tax=Sphingomonas astaxanthinifaciens DSM 22298 TaxID=1123267 RepID=A0ABQ5Z559_9SPHN|nr:hypothetical protein [Sphingomonas astaxanthinifaciens]GLR46632.1 hypothetical protein GCM10007925_03430 [Sphingomonas astaxanthinifaciens DSM 22298]